MRDRMRSVAVLGVMAVGGTVLAACGGGAGPQTGAGATRPGAASTTSTAPTTSTTSTAPTTSTTSTAPTGAGTTSSAPTGAGTTSGSHGPLLIVKAFDGTVSYDGKKPRTIDISGDSTNIVRDLTWSSWGPTAAVGHGTLGVNDCQPDCATGTVHHEPVTIDLGAVVQGHFTAMTEKAQGVDRNFSYPSNWASGAS